jgi:dUTP pyrophosphatase
MVCGKFEKVSKGNFLGAAAFLPNAAEAYESLVLPRRATKGSAGYDFFSPYSFTLAAGESATIPTGVRVKIADGFALFIFPRSGLGFKFRLQLDNTVGIIDSDYYGSANEGHILCRITNDGKEKKTVEIAAGQGFCQGVFLPYGLAEGDYSAALRDGGFGSTDQKAVPTL